MVLLNDGTSVRKDRPRNSPARETSAVETNDVEAFNPRNFNMDDVKAYVTENPDQRETVLDAEQSGEKRKTLIAWLEEQEPVSDETVGDDVPQGNADII